MTHMVMKATQGIDQQGWWREYVRGEDGREYRNTPEVLDNAQLLKRERRLRMVRIGNRRYAPVLTQYRYW